MPEHRALWPNDARLFSSDRLPLIRRAVSDLSVLLTRGYPVESALKLVGDHYQLRRRQRLVVRRAACSDAARDSRAQRCCMPDQVLEQAIAIDGFNLLITVESLLGGALVYRCRDGSYRDLGSVHGTYRPVSETTRAVELIGATLASLGCGPVTWMLDRPVSNSGRLSRLLLRVADERGWSWSTELHDSADRVLLATQAIVVTSDSAVLDGCGRWLNLVALLAGDPARQGWVIDLAVS